MNNNQHIVLSVVGRHIGSCDKPCEICETARAIQTDLLKSFGPATGDWKELEKDNLREERRNGDA